MGCSNKALILWANSFTAIANRITPNTFLIMLIPFCPMIRSILEEVFKTIKITNTFRIMAMIMFSILNSALRDNKVVKLPGPAIKGKARGKMVAFMASCSSCL